MPAIRFCSLLFLSTVRLVQHPNLLPLAVVVRVATRLLGLAIWTVTLAVQLTVATTAADESRAHTDMEMGAMMVVEPAPTSISPATVASDIQEANIDTEARIDKDTHHRPLVLAPEDPVPPHFAVCTALLDR